MYKCKNCGYIDTYWGFYADEVYDEECDDYVGVLECPKCKSEEIEEVE